jgi:IMP dehydrogenase
MGQIINEPSRTFHEFLLLPSLTTTECTPTNVNLSTPLTRFKKGEEPSITINIPIVSAIMQSVSNDSLAIALAREGGISFIFGSQPVKQQADMVNHVKTYKAGMVVSDSNCKPESKIGEILELIEETGHSTIPVTEDGTPGGKLLGMLTSRDYRVNKIDMNTPVNDVMTPFSSLVYAREGITLNEANDIIWSEKLNTLPIIDENDNLKYLVFRKDYDDHKTYPTELIDSEKRLLVGAGINTRDYMERVPALLNAGADVLCIDSSDGYSEYQKITIEWIKKNCGEDVKVGAGNVVDRDGFNYLADAGADFIKVGIGGGSICITREQKGIGRGQASAVIEVAAARDEYYKKTGIYIPICSDGGIVYDNHIVIALAMGSDFVMMGRYFARFDESPGRKMRVGGNFVKEYWGEGSHHARNWQRYDMGVKRNPVSFLRKVLRDLFHMPVNCTTHLI